MVMAASAAASRPAIGTRAAAITSNSTSMLSTPRSAPSAGLDVAVAALQWVSGVVVGQSDGVQHGGVDRSQSGAPGEAGPMVAPGVQQLVLQPEHLSLFGG